MSIDLSHVEDAELVRGALAGSQDAYRELLRRFERPVFTLIVRMVKDPATAEDLAQDAFVKAFAAFGSYDPRWKLSSWLFKIAHNTTIDHLRRRRIATVALEAEESDDEGGGGLLAFLADEKGEAPTTRVERADLAAALENAIGRLRPDHAQAITLRFQEGLEYAEIADVMDLPLGTVKTHLHRARKALAKMLTADGWAPPGYE